LLFLVPCRNENPREREDNNDFSRGTAAQEQPEERKDGEEAKGEEGEEPEELFETNWELEVDNFDDMGLKEEVLRGIYAFGFKEPSPIQQKGILPVI
jgi:translation initiation factor 4A